MRLLAPGVQPEPMVRLRQAGPALAQLKQGWLVARALFHQAIFRLASEGELQVLRCQSPVGRGLTPLTHLSGHLWRQDPGCQSVSTTL